MSIFGDLGMGGDIGLGALIGGPIGAAFGAEIGGGQQAAEAKGQAALAQQQMQLLQQQQALGYAQPTLAELQQQQQQIQTQTQGLARQEQLLSAIDPAIMEAGKQALQLMRGQSAGTLAPLQQQRDVQRQRLVSQINEQYGEGGVNSTGGASALNQFDMQTAQILSQAQQQSLGQLLGVAAGSRPNPFGGVSSGSTVLSNLFAPQQLSIGALGQFSGTNYAGAPFVQAGAEGANIASIASGGLNLAGTVAGAALGAKSGGGAATPRAQPGASDFQGELNPNFGAIA